DTLWAHAKQAEGDAGHRILLHEFFRRNLRLLDRAIGRRHDIEVFEFAAGIPKRDIRGLQQPIGTGALYALAADHSFDTFLSNAHPARASASRTLLGICGTHECILHIAVAAVYDPPTILSRVESPAVYDRRYSNQFK